MKLLNISIRICCSLSPQLAPDPTAGVLTARTAPACAGCKHTRGIHAPRADPFYYCCHAERSVHSFFLIIFLSHFQLCRRKNHTILFQGEESGPKHRLQTKNGRGRKRKSNVWLSLQKNVLPVKRGKHLENGQKMK